MTERGGTRKPDFAMALAKAKEGMGGVECKWCFGTKVFLNIDGAESPCPGCCREDYLVWKKRHTVEWLERKGTKEYGRHFVDKDLSNFETHTTPARRALVAVKRYLKHLEDNLALGRGITFVGPVDTGKSHLLVGLKKAAAAKGVDIALCNMLDILVLCRKIFHNEKLDEYDLLQPYVDVPYLILDDFGVELSTKPNADNSWMGRLLYYLVHNRWVEQRPLFISTNYELEQLEELLGDVGSRITSRLFRMNGPAVLINCEQYSPAHWRK